MAAHARLAFKRSFSKSYTVRHLFKRALCAALPLCLVATAASAEEHSAIATGMAIPVGAIASPSTPVPSRGRFVLVDAASARLYMVVNGNVVESMKVVVGKPCAATPTLPSTIILGYVRGVIQYKPDDRREECV